MIVSHPISEVPLPLAQSDGSSNKTEKATFTKILEGKQQNVLDEKSIGRVNASMFDEGLLVQNCSGFYGETRFCSWWWSPHLAWLLHYSLHQGSRASQIKDNTCQITGPEQQQEQKGSELLNDGCFEEQFGRFLLMEAQKAHHYSPVIGVKTINISHGGGCVRIGNRWGQMEGNEP